MICQGSTAMPGGDARSLRASKTDHLETAHVVSYNSLEQLWSVLAVLVSLLAFTERASSAAELTPSQTQFFENKIRPVLANNCYKCHSPAAERVKGGLLLDTREGLLKGGETGPAIV